MSISETRVHLLNWRTSYFYGHEPFVPTKPNADGTMGKPTFCSHFLAPPTHPDIPKISAAIVAAAKVFWPDKWKIMLESFQAKSKIPLRKGEIHKPGEEAYVGMMSLSGNSKGRFSIVETRGGKNVPLVAADGRPYSGCYVNAIVNFYGYNKGGGIGIGCGIEGVQFLRNGDAFGGGRVAAPDEFGIISADSADGAAPPEDDISNLLGLGT